MSKLRKMCEIISTIVIAGTLYAGCLTPVAAQNPTCPTRPFGDTSNACANTAFVQQNKGGAFTGDVFFGSGRPWTDVRSTANGTCAAAVGDGVTNDQPAIQCQVNYLSSNFGGGTLYAAAGNYHLASALTIPTGVNVLCSALGPVAFSVNTDITAITTAPAATSIWFRSCEIVGLTVNTATQNLVVVPAGANVSFYDSFLVGGNFALQTAGTDGVVFNTIIKGYGSSGGGVFSTGANWYIHAKIDQGAATAVGFKQSTAGVAQENHFVHTDISGAYTNSIVIDDASSSAITVFEGGVISAPVLINNAAATMFSTTEFGSPTFTFNAGSLSIVGSKILVGSITVGGAGTSINCAGNIGIDCKGANSTPGGSNTQIQYNNNGIFGGIAGVTTNGTALTIASSDLILSGASSGSSTLNAPATGGGVATLFAGADTIAGKTLTNGGTNNSLTASNGGIVWSDASKLNILAGTATANLPLLSGATATPAWATITYPTSATSGGIPYFSSTTAITSSAALNNNTLVSGGGAGGAPKNSGLTVTGSDLTSLNAVSSVAALPQFDLRNNVVDANSASFLMRKSRNSADTTTNDSLHDYETYGWANGSFQVAARWQVFQTAASSGSNIPTKHVWSNSNTAGQINQTMTFDSASHLYNAQATAPSISAGCTGAGSGVVGTDLSGTVTGSTAAATTCTLTFGTAYAAAPNCTVSGLSSPLTGAVTLATGTIVVNFASTANFKWTYICHGA